MVEVVRKIRVRPGRGVFIFVLVRFVFVTVFVSLVFFLPPFARRGVPPRDPHPIPRCVFIRGQARLRRRRRSPVGAIAPAPPAISPA